MRSLGSLLVSVVLAIVLFMRPYACQAQHDNRNYVKEQILKVGECRNVAITMFNGDLMLYGTSGWTANDCPIDLTTALRELDRAGEFIEDVHLTESSNWIIQYGDNKFRWSGIPRSLKKKIKYYTSGGETITSVTFNDLGDWIVITTKHFSASDSELQDWLEVVNEEQGQIWNACITDDAIVVVCENGYGHLGDIPTTLMDSLVETDMFVRKLKIAGEAWFFSDGVKDYDYQM